VLGVFWGNFIYGTLAKTLFSIGHMGCSSKKGTDPKSEEKLNNVSKPKSSSLITVKWFLQRKENLIPLLNWLFQQVETKWVSKI